MYSLVHAKIDRDCTICLTPRRTCIAHCSASYKSVPFCSLQVYACVCVCVGCKSRDCIYLLLRVGGVPYIYVGGRIRASPSTGSTGAAWRRACWRHADVHSARRWEQQTTASSPIDRCREAGKRLIAWCMYAEYYNDYNVHQFSRIWHGRAERGGPGRAGAGRGGTGRGGAGRDEAGRGGAGRGGTARDEAGREWVRRAGPDGAGRGGAWRNGAGRSTLGRGGREGAWRSAIQGGDADGSTYEVLSDQWHSVLIYIESNYRTHVHSHNLQRTAR